MKNRTDRYAVPDGIEGNGRPEREFIRVRSVLRNLELDIVTVVRPILLGTR